MFSEVSSEQLCVHEEQGYDEVYLSGQDDLGISYLEKGNVCQLIFRGGRGGLRRGQVKE